MIQKLRKELQFFQEQGQGMRMLLLTNLIYGMVTPIIELFIGAYIMRNSDDLSLVVIFQLAVYTGIPLTFGINGWLLQNTPGPPTAEPAPSDAPAPVSARSSGNLPGHAVVRPC